MTVKKIEASKISIREMKQKLISPVIHVCFITKAFSDENGKIVGTEDSYFITGPIYLKRLFPDWIYFLTKEVHYNGSEFKMICDSEHQAYAIKLRLELEVAIYNQKLIQIDSNVACFMKLYEGMYFPQGEAVKIKKKRGKKK